MKRILLTIFFLTCAVPLQAGNDISLGRLDDPEFVDFLSNRKYLGSKFEIFFNFEAMKHSITFCSDNARTCGKEQLYLRLTPDGEYPMATIYVTPPADSWDFVRWIGWVGKHGGHYSFQLRSKNRDSNGNGNIVTETVYDTTANWREATLAIAGKKTQLQRIQDKSRVAFLSHSGERGRVRGVVDEIVMWNYNSGYGVCYSEWNNYANDDCGKYQLYLALTGTGEDPARVLYISPETYGWKYLGIVRKAETEEEDDFTVLEFEERYLAHNGTKPLGWRTRPWELYVNQWKAFLRKKED